MNNFLLGKGHKLQSTAPPLSCIGLRGCGYSKSVLAKQQLKAQVTRTQVSGSLEHIPRAHCTHEVAACSSLN